MVNAVQKLNYTLCEIQIIDTKDNLNNKINVIQKAKNISYSSNVDLCSNEEIHTPLNVIT